MPDRRPRPQPRKARDMAFTTTQHAAPSLLERIATFKADMAERYSKYRVYRNTLSELQSLSMRELNDLGLSPANIKSVAYEAAYKA